VRVFVTGAAGFLGRETCRTLAARGYDVTGLTHGPEGAQPLPSSSPDGVNWVRGDVRDWTPEMARSLTSAGAVIHLVGIAAEAPARGQTFEAIHADGTRGLVQALRNAERRCCQRLVYVSACGAALESPSGYFRSKAAAEEEIRHSTLPWTILRPSVIVGPGSGFLTQIERLMRRPPLLPFRLPVVPLPGSAASRFQPVHVSDVASCIVRALETEEAAGETVEVGGASVVTLAELVAAVRDRAGVVKPLRPIPMPLLFATAACLEALLPHPPLTTDQLIALEQDNVCDLEKMRDLLGVTPRTFAEALDATYRKDLTGAIPVGAEGSETRAGEV